MVHRFPALRRVFAILTVLLGALFLFSCPLTGLVHGMRGADDIGLVAGGAAIGLLLVVVALRALARARFDLKRGHVSVVQWGLPVPASRHALADCDLAVLPIMRTIRGRTATFYSIRLVAMGHSYTIGDWFFREADALTFAQQISQLTRISVSS